MAEEKQMLGGEKCPACGAGLKCLAGRSAHPSNWYCEIEDNCGWRAWEFEPIKMEKISDEKIKLVKRKLAILAEKRKIKSRAKDMKASRARKRETGLVEYRAWVTPKQRELLREFTAKLALEHK